MTTTGRSHKVQAECVVVARLQAYITLTGFQQNMWLLQMIRLWSYINDSKSLPRRYTDCVTALDKACYIHDIMWMVIGIKIVSIVAVTVKVVGQSNTV